MKQIIIFLLVIILAVMGYNYYKKYQRFNPPNYEYVAAEAIDNNHPHKALLLDYQEAIALLDGYVITQWSANGIDVRNPSDDDQETEAAVLEYTKKLANVKFYESQLLAPQMTEESPKELSEAEEKKNIIQKMFYVNPMANSLRLGERSALVYEVQRLLNEKGATIEHDGLFSSETFSALKAFQEKNGLFANGKLDALTLSLIHI